MDVPSYCPYCGDDSITLSQSKVWFGGWIIECPECGEIKIGSKIEKEEL